LLLWRADEKARRGGAGTPSLAANIEVVAVPQGGTPLPGPIRLLHHPVGMASNLKIGFEAGTVLFVFNNMAPLNSCRRMASNQSYFLLFSTTWWLRTSFLTSFLGILLRTPFGIRRWGLRFPRARIPAPRRLAVLAPRIPRPAAVLHPSR